MKDHAVRHVHLAASRTKDKFGSPNQHHAVRYVRVAACRTTDNVGPRCSICSRSGMSNDRLNWFSEPTARSKKMLMKNGVNLF